MKTMMATVLIGWTLWLETATLGLGSGWTRLRPALTLVECEQQRQRTTLSGAQTTKDGAAVRRELSCQPDDWKPLQTAAPTPDGVGSSGAGAPSVGRYVAPSEPARPEGNRW